MNYQLTYIVSINIFCRLQLNQSISQLHDLHQQADGELETQQFQQYLDILQSSVTFIPVKSSLFILEFDPPYVPQPPQEFPYQFPYVQLLSCLLYTSPSPRDRQKSRMPSSA
eukprot:TRINITY_DN918_c0_g1_i5.p2 TRINITY_DN918_c0_g1~~TRINITY_DN918_c0_g1_i5.p2  ORF type:complete len:112 (+),score=6.45 TRINITY_DN918_c0_g1_i5:117-452(+)